MQAAKAVVASARALSSELEAVAVSLTDFIRKTAAAGFHATAQRLLALSQQAAAIELSLREQEARLLRARALADAAKEAAPLIEECKKEKREAIKIRQSRVLLQQQIKLTEESLGLEDAGTEEHDALSEALAKQKQELKEIDAKHRSASGAADVKGGGGPTARLRDLCPVLPELLVQFPDLDPLFGTAAAGLQVSLSIDRDFAGVRLLQSEPNRVLRAVLKATGEECVLKQVPPALLASPQRFRQMAHVMARISHPNVVSLDAIVRDDSGSKPVVYLQTAYHAQGDLAQFIESKVRLGAVDDWFCFA